MIIILITAALILWSGLFMFLTVNNFANGDFGAAIENAFSAGLAAGGIISAILYLVLNGL